MAELTWDEFIKTYGGIERSIEVKDNRVKQGILPGVYNMYIWTRGTDNIIRNGRRFTDVVQYLVTVLPHDVDAHIFIDLNK